MARDYKSRAQRRPKKKPIPVFVWISAGYVAGLVTALVVWMNFTPGGDAPGWITPDTPVTVAPPPAKDDPAQVDDRVARPRFDFYTLLPEMEVVVPEDELDAELKPPPAPAVEPATAEQPAPKTVSAAYLLQVGSFRNPADADRVKAQLTLLGYKTSVTRVKTPNGNTTNRVRVGPIQAGSLKSQRKALAAQGFDSLVIRVKQ
ncbi:MAG: SPOR domain-containing protein [bacterium]